MEEAKAEEKLGQMIAFVLDPSSKVEKNWDLHEAYCFVRIGCIHGHNLTVDSFHTLEGDELLDNFVSKRCIYHYKVK